MDFIGHHNDIAHWGLDMDHAGPERVEAVGLDAIGDGHLQHPSRI